MVFTTYHFLFLFLPVVLAVYYVLNSVSRTARTVWLTGMTLVFYGWARVDFAALLVISTIMDYWCGKFISTREGSKRKVALAISICVNMGLLLYFKYFNLAMDTTNSLIGVFGGHAIEFARVALPAGISFYTFETMSYSIDIYRREATPAKSLLEMSGFVAFFPRLVAGPIVRYHDIAKQLDERTHTIEKFGRGVLLVMCGFSKKILLADSAARLADEVFGQAAPGAAAAWLGIIGYTLQIYFDFSGYSDIAIGLGKMFGFEFIINFASPYRSKSITEFWRRWHISLSNWLRDYLYVPLGGNRKGPVRTYVNLALTMLLGGLWHGAQWTFLAWGAFHGLWLAIERAIGKKAPWSFLPGPLQTAFTLVLVMIGWVFFRAETFGKAGVMLKGMAGLSGWDAGLSQVMLINPLYLGLSTIALVLVYVGIQSDKLVEIRGTIREPIIAFALSLSFMAAVAHMLFQEYSPFLYFQF